MSHWVYLFDKNGGPLKVDNHSEGGTYAIGGSDDAELNVTYNYGRLYHEQLNKDSGLRWLDGKKAKDCIKVLEKAVNALGIERDNDYWKATPGNAGYALSILLGWAKQHPKGIFEVS